MCMLLLLKVSHRSLGSAHSSLIFFLLFLRLYHFHCPIFINSFFCLLKFVLNSFSEIVILTIIL